METEDGSESEQQQQQACSQDMMALDNCSLFPHQPSLAWDTHTFEVGIGAADLHEFMPLESPASSEASTGYLQDAVAEWTDRCKRRRMAFNYQLRDDDSMSMTEDLQDLLQGFWDSNCQGDPLDSLSYLVQDNSTDVKAGPVNPSMLPQGPNKEEVMTALQLQQGELAHSSSSSQKEPSARLPDGGEYTHESKDSKSCQHPSSALKGPPKKEIESERYRKKKAAMGVVYPFAVLKPGGVEGDVTLDDINARLLMRPARPVRHPVGEFACGPCVSADGPGLSGKAVVSLTRIQTKGRGTITIIRTKG